eukprot:CAMPEP_0204824784 /NCGR_PEP_ID=MMETSP1346-20131115/2766_1 /ASSEMBLY_ACC=CAM_ASM_000771 /TAXON_ID=215587 /ORGANISM="Aplanochytrium stocchinoi, Strain GSBS06" /LENGTH=439 /DNA_ID=CAMNT_0051952119 /DNA_START=732 /DNA_END=2051 /DNA_ORIENTATION=+
MENIHLILEERDKEIEAQHNCSRKRKSNVKVAFGSRVIAANNPLTPRMTPCSHAMKISTSSRRQVTTTTPRSMSTTGARSPASVSVNNNNKRDDSEQNCRHYQRKPKEIKSPDDHAYTLESENESKEDVTLEPENKITEEEGNLYVDNDDISYEENPYDSENEIQANVDDISKNEAMFDDTYRVNDEEDDDDAEKVEHEYAHATATSINVLYASRGSEYETAAETSDEDVGPYSQLQSSLHGDSGTELIKEDLNHFQEYEGCNDEDKKPETEISIIHAEKSDVDSVDDEFEPEINRKITSKTNYGSRARDEIDGFDNFDDQELQEKRAELARLEESLEKDVFDLGSVGEQSATFAAIDDLSTNLDKSCEVGSPMQEFEGDMPESEAHIEPMKKLETRDGNKSIDKEDNDQEKEKELDLIYDPILCCYFCPRTNKYYTMK